jgi:hypothetical protein
MVVSFVELTVSFFVMLLCVSLLALCVTPTPTLLCRVVYDNFKLNTTLKVYCPAIRIWVRDYRLIRSGIIN